MKWANLAVKPNFSWPNVQVTIPYEGRKIVLQPFSQELSCAVSVFDDCGLSFEDGGTILSRFLSRLAWSMNSGVIELFFCGSNHPNHPGRLGRGGYEPPGRAAVEPWDYLYLPSARDENADLGIALFREGMSVNSVPFAFLSYFKILNIKHSTGAAQKKWVNANIAKIWYQPAVERLRELTKAISDLGEYLYHQGRCAVAHANGTPLVNPDCYGDKRRLELDLPLIKEIACLFIEQELGVMSNNTFCQHYRDTYKEPPELLKKTVGENGQIEYQLA